MSDRPMDWRDYALARQYLTEHRIGTRLREAQHIEDDKFRQSSKALQRLKGA